MKLKRGFYQKLVGAPDAYAPTKKFGFTDKLSYAMGDFGCNMSFALNSFLLFFWTEYMGIPNSIWAIMIVGLKIWDAFNDPIMGALLDAIKIKPGKSKFKPWIFYGSFLLLFSGALCFMPISVNSPMAIKIIIAIVGYLVWDTAYTIVNVPYGTMNSVISADGAERAELSTWRSLGSIVANIGISFTLPLIIYSNEGKLLGNLLFPTALVMGGIGLFAFAFFVLGTTERVTNDNIQAFEKDDFSLWESIKAFFKNGPVLVITLVSIIQFVVQLGFLTSLNAYFIRLATPTYAKYMGLIQILSFVPTILITPFVAILVKKFSKKTLVAFPFLLTIAAGALMFTIPFNTFASNHLLTFVIWASLVFLAGLGAVGINMFVWAMIADCIDYQEMQTGRREEGIVYANYSLGRKLAQGFAGGLASLAVTWVGIIFKNVDGKNVPVPKEGLSVSDVLFNIRFGLGMAYIVCFATMFFLIVFLYRLNKKKLTEVRKFVAVKHGIKLHDESKDLSHERFVENVITPLDPKHLRKIKKAQGLVRKGKCHTYKEVINFLNTK